MKRLFLALFLALLFTIPSCSDYSWTIAGTWILSSGSCDNSDGLAINYSIGDREYITLGGYGLCRRNIQINAGTDYDVVGTWSATESVLTFVISSAPYSGTVSYNYSVSGDTLTISNGSGTLVYTRQW